MVRQPHERKILSPMDFKALSEILLGNFKLINSVGRVLIGFKYLLKIFFKVKISHEIKKADPTFYQLFTTSSILKIQLSLSHQHIFYPPSR